MIHIKNPDDPFPSIHDGDIVEFRGGEHRGRIILTNNNITLRAKASHEVWLDGENTFYGHSQGSCIHMSGLSEVYLDGINVKNSGAGPTFNAGASTGITAINCDSIVWQNSKGKDTAASMFWGNNCSNILISHVEGEGLCYAGSQEGITLVKVNGFDIGDCYIHDFPVSLKDQWEPYEHRKEGIDCKVGCRNGLVHHNKIHGTRTGIYIDGWDMLTENIVVCFNEVYDSEVGMSLNAEQGGEAKNISFHDNYSHDNYYHGYMTSYSISSVNGLSIYNNKFSNNSGQAIAITAQGKVFRNLLVHGNDFMDTPQNNIDGFWNKTGYSGTYDLTPVTVTISELGPRPLIQSPSEPPEVSPTPNLVRITGSLVGVSEGLEDMKASIDEIQVNIEDLIAELTIE